MSVMNFVSMVPNEEVGVKVFHLFMSSKKETEHLE
jgi:hypothetical protein